MVAYLSIVGFYIDVELAEETGIAAVGAGGAVTAGRIVCKGEFAGIAVLQIIRRMAHSDWNVSSM